MSGQGPGQIPVTPQKVTSPLTPPPAIRVTPLGIEIAVAPPSAPSLAEQTWKAAGADLAAVKTLSDAWNWFVAPPITPGPQLTAPVGPYVPAESPPLPSAAAYQSTDMPNLTNTGLRSRYGSIFESMQSFQNTPLPTLSPAPQPTLASPKLSPPVQEPEEKKSEEKPKGLKKITEGAKKLLGLKSKKKEKKEDPKVSTVVIGTDPLTGKTQTAKVVVAKDAKSAGEAAKALSQGASAESAAKVAAGGNSKDLPKAETTKSDAPKTEVPAEPTTTVVVVANSESAPRPKGEKAPTAAEVQQQAVQKATEAVTQVQATANVDKMTEALLGIPPKPTAEASPVVVVVQDGNDKKAPQPAPENKLLQALALEPKKAETAAPKTAAETKAPPTAQEAVGQAQQAISNATAVAAQGGSLEQIAAELTKPEANQALDAKVVQALTTEPKKGEAPIVVVQAPKPTPADAKTEPKPETKANPTAKEAVGQAQQAVANATAVAAQGGSLEQIAAELTKPEANQALDAKVVQALTTEPKKGEAPIVVVQAKPAPGEAKAEPKAESKANPTAKEAVGQAQQAVANATAVAAQGGSLEQIAAELTKPEANQALDAKVVQALTTEPKKGEVRSELPKSAPPKTEEKPAEKGSFKEASNKANQSVQEATEKVQQGGSLEEVARTLNSPQATEALDAKAAEALSKSDKKPKGEAPIARAPEPRAAEPKAGEPKAGEPKAGEPKAAEPKAGEPKAGEPKAGEPKAGEPKAGEPKAAEPKASEPKAGEPKAAEPKAGEPKAGEPKAAEPKAADLKAGEPKAGEPRAGEPKAAEPKAAEPKAADLKAGEPKAAEPKAGEPKAAEPKAGEPKAAEPRANMRAEAREDQKAEARPENRNDSKNEPRPEARPEVRNESRLVGEAPEVRPQPVPANDEPRGAARVESAPNPRPNNPRANAVSPPNPAQTASPPSGSALRSEPNPGATRPIPVESNPRAPQYRVASPQSPGGNPAVSVSSVQPEESSAFPTREARTQAGISAAQATGSAPSSRPTVSQRSQEAPAARSEVAGGGTPRPIESASNSSGQQQGSGGQQSPQAPVVAQTSRTKSNAEVAAEKPLETPPAPQPVAPSPAPVRPQVPTPPMVTYQAPKETPANEPIWEDRFREANREEREKEIQQERRAATLPPTPGKPGVVSGPTPVITAPSNESPLVATAKTTATTGAVTAQQVEEAVAAAEAATGSPEASGHVPVQVGGIAQTSFAATQAVGAAAASASPEAQVKEISDRVAHGEAPALVNGNVETMVKQAGTQNSQASGAQQPGHGGGSEGGEMGGGGAGADSSGGHSSGGHQQGSSSSGNERDNTITKLNALSVGELQQLLLQTLFAMEGTTARVKGAEGEDGPVLLNLNDVVEIRGANGQLMGTRVLTKKEVFETNFRTNLIRAAELADPTWNSSEQGVDLPGAGLQQPETRGEGVSITARNGFWEVVEQQGQRSLQVRAQNDQGEAVAPSAALNDLFENKEAYALDNSISLRLLNLKAQLETVGAEDFDRNYRSLSLSVQGEQKTHPVYLGFQATSGGNRPFQPGEDRLIPGELRYFESAPNQGTSRLYLGRGKDGMERFWALDEGISQFDFRESAPVIVSGDSREILTSWSGAPPVSQLLALDADTDFLA